MKLKIKVKLGQVFNIEEVLKTIAKLEKEYNCHCTLLEVEIN